MSYCRFRNTLNDLQDCYDNWYSLDESKVDESEAREKLFRLCEDITLLDEPVFNTNRSEQ